MSSGYCGKVLYICIINVTLILSCVVLSMRARVEIEDLIMKRAKENKGLQMEAISQLMENVVGVVQDSELKEKTLVEMTNILNTKYLLGTYEVLLVSPTECAGNQNPCGLLHVLTSPKLLSECPIVENDGIASRVCDLDKLSGVSAAVLALDSNALVGSIQADDYTHSEVLYFYNMIPNSKIGLIFKQHVSEIKSSTDVLFRLRWGTGLITFAFAAVVSFVLLILLKEIQQGKGYLYVALLCMFAVFGVMSLVSVMLYIASLDEGVAQQKSETADSAALLLALYKSLSDTSLGQGSMHESILFSWVTALNKSPRMHPDFEAVLYQQKSLGPGEAARTRIVGELKNNCPTQCAIDMVTTVVQKANTFHEAEEILLFHNGRPGYMLSIIDKTSLISELKFGVAWLCEKSYATTPYKDVVSSLWGRTTLLMVGYILVSLFSSGVVARMLPFSEVHVLGKTILSRMLPLVTVVSLCIPLLLVVHVSSSSIDGIGKHKESYQKKAFGTDIGQRTLLIENELWMLKAAWYKALLDTSGMSTPLIKEIQNELVTQIYHLHEVIETFEGELSNSAKVSSNLKSFVDEYATVIIHSTVSDMSSVDIRGNSSFIQWQSQDPILEAARYTVTELAATLSSEGFSGKSPQVAMIVDIESILYQVEILYRREVIRANAEYFYEEYNKLYDEFKRRKFQVESEWSKQMAESGLSSSIDVTKLRHTLDNIASHIDYVKRGFLLYSTDSTEMHMAELASVITRLSEPTATLPSPVLLLTSSGEGVEERLVREIDFFDELVSQMEGIRRLSLVGVNRHHSISNAIEFEQSKIKTISIVGIITVCVAWLTITVSLHLYLRDARCNLGPGGSCLAPYPWVEIRDMTIVITIIALLFVTEQILIRTYADIQLREIIDNNKALISVADTTFLTNTWTINFNKYLMYSSEYIFTGSEVAKHNAEETRDTIERLKEVRANTLDRIIQGGDDTVIGEVFESATNAVCRMITENQETLQSRSDFDGRRGTHAYKTLKFLVNDQFENEKIKLFLRRMTESQTLSVATRAEWIASSDEFVHSQVLVAKVEKYEKGIPTIKWTPSSFTVKTAVGYRLIFRSELPENSNIKANLNIGTLTSSSVVRSLRTASSMWVVPFAHNFSLAPGGELILDLIVVLSGSYELENEHGDPLVTVNVVGDPLPTYIDLGISPRGVDMMNDPRATSDSETPPEQIDVVIPPTGGFAPLSIQFESNVNYQVSLTDKTPNHCLWELTHSSMYCSADLSVDISRDGISLIDCQARVAVNPQCRGLLVYNEHLCRCLSVKYPNCDFQESIKGSSIHQLNCDKEPQPVADLEQFHGIDFSALEGHVVWKRISDQSCTLNVPSVISIAIRYTQGEIPFSGKRTFVSMIPVDKGSYTLQNLDGTVKDQSFVTQGCFRYLTQPQCFNDITCVWNGVECAPSSLPKKLVPTHNTDIPDNLWVRLQLHRASHILHTNHLAYLISDENSYLETSLEYEKYLLQNMTEIRDISHTLIDEFYVWKHAMEIERNMRKDLSNIVFVEDIFTSQVALLQYFGNQTRAAFNFLTTDIRSQTARATTWSDHNTRYIFWSSCVTSWTFALLAIFVLSRLDMAVRLSNSYSYHNVPEGSAYTRYEDEETLND